MLLKTSKNKLNLKFFLINLVLLFGLLTPYILSYETIDYENDFSKLKTAEPKKSFKINFSNSDVLNYVHLIVEPISGSISNQILSYGTEETCTKNRQLLSMNPDPTAKVELFLTKSQIEENFENNYLCVECANATTCTFNLIMKSEKTCQLDLGKQYTYYVYSNKSTTMTFTIKDTDATQNDEYFVTIWARARQNQFNSTLENIKNKEEKNFGTGNIYSFKRSEIKEYVLSINAEFGDLITVGSGLSKKESNTNPIYPNSLEVMGYLKKGFKERECYNLLSRGNTKYTENDVLFVNGLVFERYASLQYMNDDTELYTTLINDGTLSDALFALYFNEGTMKVCVTFNETSSNQELVYTFQLEDNKHKAAVPIHYPQELGTIYKRYSLSGQLTTYSSVRPVNNLASAEFNYNMKAVTGFPDMLFGICKNYPKCDYSNKDFANITNPRHSNFMTTYSEYTTGNEYYTPISAIQPLILVNCTDGTLRKIDSTDSKDRPKSDYCIFETSIFSEQDHLSLHEAAPFSQFLLAAEKDNYKIALEDESSVSKIYLDLYLYTGDVNFTDFFAFIKKGEELGLEAHQYCLANKIFYSMTVTNNANKEIYFSVSAIKNSFYTISYQLVRSNEDFSIGKNLVESGASYLQSIDLTWEQKMKHIKLQNTKTNLGSPFLTNFFSLNCDFIVNRLSTDENGNQVNKSVLIADNYGQDIINNQEYDYYNEYYEYTVEAVNNDIYEYNKKLCMIYVSGVEIETTSTGMEREISVPENVPQQIVFEKAITKIKYVYHLVDIKDTVIILFDLIDKAPYKLQIYYGYNRSEIKEFAKNSQFEADEVNKYCEIDEVCNIIFEITLNRNEMKDNSLEPKLETTIRQKINGGPSYLPKNVFQRDILVGEYPRYYYTDLGAEEMGEVVINYNRGSGKIYGKIVKKDINVPEENPNWRGLYKFPNSTEESVIYDTYSKKLEISADRTKECQDGCYLLVTVQYSVETEMKNPNEFHPFSIMSRIYPKDAKDLSVLPKIEIEVNQYVVGDVFAGEGSGSHVFYEVWFPYDADTVVLEWQNDHASLHVNVGEEKPTNRKTHFNFKSVGHDTIFTLSKKEILESYEKNKINVPNQGSLKDLSLVIGIWTDENNSLYTSIYALKVHLIKETSIDVYLVRSDQKVLCKPTKFEKRYNLYRCLYAVMFDGLDNINSLSVYPKSQYANAYVVSYAKFIDQDLFEKNDVSSLKNDIPTIYKNQYKTDSSKTPYYYIDKSEYGKALYISVISDDDNIIELLSGTGSSLKEIFPNPSTVQLFSTKDTLTLNFVENKDWLINIVSLNGDAFIYWEDEEQNKCSLHGIDDRLSLTSGEYKNYNASNKLVFKSTDQTTDKDNPGFLFYISYSPRSYVYNLDQLTIGKSTEFNYRNADFPINFIVPLKDLKAEIYASVNFYRFEDDKNTKKWFNEKDVLSIWGTIITEEKAFEARLSDFYKPSNDSAIEGVFDGGINVALLIIDTDHLKKFENIKNPYLFFSVEKNPYANNNFTKISAEVTVLQESGNVPATEKVYQYGRIGYDKDFKSLFNCYILHVNKEKPYMRVQFSANSDLINWCISDKDNATKNISFTDSKLEYYNGKSVVTFKVPEEIKEELYLNVFPKINDLQMNVRLGSYTFKYMNGPSISQFDTYKVDNTTIDLSGNSDNYNVNVKAVRYSEVVKVSYILKGIYSDNYLEHESKSTIAVTYSKGFTLQIDNPEVNNDLVSISIPHVYVSSKLKYLKVIAKVKDYHINEYVAYDPIILDGDIIDPDKGEEHLGNKDLIKLVYVNDKISYYVKEAETKQKYLVEFKGNVPNYLKVQVVSDKTPSQIIYFSTSDEEGMKDREQLAQNGASKEVEMWLKKEQFSGYNKKLYIVVECLDQKSRNYNLIFTGHEKIEVESNFRYSYYVSSWNTKMEFKVNLYESYDSAITLYGRGSDNLSLQAYGNILGTSEYKFKLGSAITFNIPSNMDHLELVVNAAVGDYITVGGYIVVAKKFTASLNVNQEEVSGYLKKNLIDDVCYIISDLYSSDYSEEESDVYITAKFYNRIGEFYLMNSLFEPIEETVTLVENGAGFLPYHVKELLDKTFSVCVRFPTKNTTRFTIEDIPFSLQVIVPNSIVGRTNIHSPQANGIIYRRVLHNDTVAYYSGMKSNDKTIEVNYNMKSNTGNSEMYIKKCETYPVCNFVGQDLKEEERVHEINRVTAWYTNNKIKSPIDPNQNVLVVKCTAKEGYCAFDTMIFGNEDYINLIEKEPISQYVVKNEIDHYVIDFRFENGIKKVYLDALVISGDVSFDLYKDEKGNSVLDEVHKYYLANKIFFSINLENNYGLDRIYLRATAKLNSYYELQSRLVRSADDQLLNDISSGISYLVSIDPATKYKNITINNTNALEKNTFMTNFYSLNCKFNITRSYQSQSQPKRKNIPLYDNYAQETLTPDSDDYHTYSYEYHIEIIEEDSSNFDKKMCMLYVSSFEATNSNLPSVQREIVVSENVPQTVIFGKNLRKIRYLYPQADPNKDLVVDFKMMDWAKYSINTIINYKQLSKLNCTGDEIFYTPKKTILSFCEEDSLCPIIIEIEFLEQNREENPMAECTIRQTLNIPTYLPKDVAKKDFVINQHYLYLYTDVGENEQGYLTVDFYRGSGKVYGKIVKKNQITPDNDANWRQYKMPSEGGESQLEYDAYIKRLSFTPDNTVDCKEGCLLLVAIKSSISGNFDEEYRFYPITVLASITPAKREYYDIPKIVLHADEYVVGNLGLDTSERLYLFYQIWLPHDADKVEFDWQSDAAALYVNVGDERPTKENAHFKLGSKWSDTIFEINSTAILDRAKRNGNIDIPYTNSLKYISLVIGIGATAADSISTTVYSLKVHLPMKSEINDKPLNIYKVESDQKTLCNPDKIGDNQYRCLFIILYNELNLVNNLTVYAESQDKSAITNMYADFIDVDLYNFYMVNQLYEIVPNDTNSKYNTKKENVNYIYITINEFKKHLYVSVITDKPSVLEFLSTFYTYDKVISPNPSSTQLFSVSQESMTFLFPTNNLLINLASLYGEADIYWENDKKNVYYLRGRDDRLTLTSPTKNEDCKLIIKNKTPSKEINGTNEMKNPGFTFYISYYLRPYNKNFDEIPTGKTLEMAYSKSDFPIYLYSILEDVNYDLDIALTFKDMELENNAATNVINSDDFKLNGAVVDKQSIYKSIINPSISPKSDILKEGVFDPAIKTAYVFLTKEYLQKFNIKNEEKPTLYFEMWKDSNSKIGNYSKFSAEISIIKENADVPTTEKLYQYGKIGGDKVNSYRLKVNGDNGFMRIQFSANSDNVGFAINIKKKERTNSTDIKFTTTTSNGIGYITFNNPKNTDFIYLNVFAKKKDVSEKLNNYVFKYINADSEKLFKTYKAIDNTNLERTYDKNKKKLTIKFNKIEDPKVNVTYSLKHIYREKHLAHEFHKTIAVTESPSKVVQKVNPTSNDSKTLSIEMDDINNEDYVIQVIAQIMDGPITDYVCYTGLETGKDKEDKISSGVPVWVIILVVVLSLIIIIILVVVIISFRSKNKDLMEKVNKISFVQSKVGERSGEANLLLCDNQNELE